MVLKMLDGPFAKISQRLADLTPDRRPELERWLETRPDLVAKDDESARDSMVGASVMWGRTLCDAMPDNPKIQEAVGTILEEVIGMQQSLIVPPTTSEGKVSQERNPFLGSLIIIPPGEGGEEAKKTCDLCGKPL